jgi:hypothetical protein
MNNTPIVKDQQLRPLTKFAWNRIREFFPSEKSRGKEISFLAIFGYAALASLDEKETLRAYNDDDAFFDAMAKVGMSYTEDDETIVGEYVQGVINRWEAAQIEVEQTGKLES